MSGERSAPDLCAPWKVDEFSGTIIWGMDNEGHPIRIADIRGWGSLTGNPYGLEDNDAVAVQDKWAALIAAAPDLLEALKNALGVLFEEDLGNRWGHIIDPISSLIARAEGREP